jgi:hypothetical protein
MEESHEEQAGAHSEHRGQERQRGRPSAASSATRAGDRRHVIAPGKRRGGGLELDPFLRPRWLQQLALAELPSAERLVGELHAGEVLLGVYAVDLPWLTPQQHQHKPRENVLYSVPRLGRRPEARVVMIQAPGRARARVAATRGHHPDRHASFPAIAAAAPAAAFQAIPSAAARRPAGRAYE